jgi:hypothetical protein
MDVQCMRLREPSLRDSLPAAMPVFGVKAGESEEFKTATRMVASLLALCGNGLRILRMRPCDVCLCFIVLQLTPSTTQRSDSAATQCTRSSGAGVASGEKTT